MTAKEFHIALDIQCQKLNSNAYSNVLPEQKDWLLNESVLRFIKQRINPRSNSKKQGFADTIKRYVDLEELITPATIPLFKNDDNSLFGIMPYNCLYPISSKTNVAFDCNGLTNTTLASNNAETVCIAELKNPTNLYNTFKIELDNGSGFTTILNVNTSTYLTAGLPSIEAKFVLINWVLEEWNKLGQGVYFVKWEKYDNIYAKNSFIFVSKTLTNISIRMTTTIADTYNFTIRAFNKYTYTIGNVNLAVNRIVKTNEYDDLLFTSFGTTIPTSPLCKLEGGRIIVNHSKKFIANNLDVNFIRFPRKIDINLNQGNELNPSTDDEIISMTVQKIKAILDSKNYQNIINETNLTE